MIWSLLLGCPTPPTRAPLGDTALPTALPTPSEDAVEIGEAVVCQDGGRDERFWDDIELPTSRTPPMMWDASGMVVADFDGDGAPEIFVAGRFRSQLFTRVGDRWIDVAPTWLTGTETGGAVGGSAADVDGDGDLDLFVTRFGMRNRLLENRGTHFVDVTEAAGIPDGDGRSSSSSWGDIDGDGDLDLFVGNYGEAPPNAWSPSMGPGDPSQLLLNDGAGHFTPRPDLIPQSVHDGYTFMSGFYDVDGDSLPELFVIQDFGWVRPSTLLWNEGGTFVADDGTAQFHPNFAGMGLAVGDVNGDGLMDFAQSSYQDVSLLYSQKTSLYPRGVGWAEFADVTGLAIDLEFDQQIFGWGTDFGDLDNDGDLDLVMGFGHWDEYQNLHWQYDGAWLQNDQGQFEPRARSNRLRLHERLSTRAVLLADIDQDGWLDVLKRTLDGPTIVHTSRCSTNRHWTSIELLDHTTSNTRGIGAVVDVRAGPFEARRWVQAGSSSMFSGGPPVVHFGLDDEPWLHEVTVTWPDGEVERFEGLPVDRPLRIERR